MRGMPVHGAALEDLQTTSDEWADHRERCGGPVNGSLRVPVKCSTAGGAAAVQCTEVLTAAAVGKSARASDDVGGGASTVVCVPHSYCSTMHCERSAVVGGVSPTRLQTHAANTVCTTSQPHRAVHSVAMDARADMLTDAVSATLTRAE